jgi:hypothetical protein
MTVGMPSVIVDAGKASSKTAVNMRGLMVVCWRGSILPRQEMGDLAVTDEIDPIDIREKLVRIDHMLADRDRKRQELRLAPWQLLLVGMAIGGGLLAIGIVLGWMLSGGGFSEDRSAARIASRISVVASRP